MDNPSALRALVTYIIGELASIEASFGKTKLVKLLYLTDVENYRRYRRTITGVRWVFFHYGPYAFEIDTALAQLHFEIPQEDVVTEKGHRAIVFRPTEGFQSSEQSLSAAQERIAKQVVKRWGLEELSPLLSYVYFHTEPMKAATRGEELDFSKIPEPEKMRHVTREVKLPSERVSELRLQFEEANRQRARSRRTALSPQPRFDELFLRFHERLKREDTLPPVKAPVELTDQAKETLREQGEM